MIKVVTFDFYNTLTKFWPPLEDIQAAACVAKGLSVPKVSLRQGYAKADILFNRANEEEPLSLRSPERRLEFFSEYEQLILSTAGVPVTPALAGEIWGLAISVPKQFMPFEETVDVLHGLKAKGYRLGVITNLRGDLTSFVSFSGLQKYLDFYVNPTIAGVEKPHPPIFEEALRQSGAEPGDVLHVGDQIRSDVAGARAMGMHAALLDRGGWLEQVDGCPKISNLTEVEALLG